MDCLRGLVHAKSTLIVGLVPLLLLPIPLLYQSQAGKCAYGILMMAVFWMTEVLPIPVTGLSALVIFPYLGVADAKILAQQYFLDIGFLIWGGICVSLCVEKWQLHRRIALKVLMTIGGSTKRLMFGFMITTFFLSMWITNTATTAMMVPIAHALGTQVEEQQAGSSNEQEKTDNIELMAPLNISHRPESKSSESEIINEEKTTKKKPESKLQKGLLLCVAYAANIGGTATLTGTTPNMVLKGQMDTLFGPESGFNFVTWFVVCFPIALVCLLFSCLAMQIMFIGPKEVFRCSKNKNQDSGADDIIRKEYAKLGKMSFAEIAVLCHFIVMVVLWLTRDPGFVPGWGVFLKDKYVTDASVAMIVAVSLFIFPSKPVYNKLEPVEALLDWETVQKGFPWGLFFVVGGGFSMAYTCKTSGLAVEISHIFHALSGMPSWLIALILSVALAALTEVTSNTATASVCLPIIAEMATSAGIHPLYLMLPSTIVTTYAFMLPVATPPNAIVFSYGQLKILDMMKAGVVINLVCVIVLQLGINSWGYYFYDLGHYPVWANNMLVTSDNDNYTTFENISMVIT